ncbi:docking protein 2 [Cylas formicarius]|uniref:docking protein 2 n=1 Tax=Cylas formicarius TaxID=197179 RepID=UPI0029586188|nr:docking protein 2 [Cylas formicarius]
MKFNTMELEDDVHRGYLLLPPGGKLLLKKSWQRKFCVLFKSSKFGIARLEIYESTDTKSGQPKIITLENVIKITIKSPTSFSVLTKAGEYDFATVSEESLQDWVSAIQNVAFPDEVSKITSIEEDNELYCSSAEGVFYVKLHPSPASQRCNLDSTNYILVLTSNAVQLRNMSDNKLLYNWPYCYIRKYGYKQGRFTFEAGRKCDSGEGIFYLEHPNQQEIFRSLANKMKSMKKLLSGESTSSLLEAGDLQLQAAINNEAGSRSPLPASLSVASLADTNISSRSHISHFEIDSQSIASLVRPKPKKPPRKTVSQKPVAPIPSPRRNADSQSVYEPICRYDTVEQRSDAWKTMGVEDINHTEQANSDEDDPEYMSWGHVKKELDNLKPDRTLAPAVITEVTSTLDGTNYDKLNFFGSSGRLNVKSGYKQVFPPPIPAVPPPASFNDYDEVQCIEPVRSADDSHLGYGVLRKDLGKKEKSEVTHQIHNQEAYAVVSKPKQV